MTKRKKIILLAASVLTITAIGVTVSMLINCEDSSQSSTADTSSLEVSVSMSSPLVSSESISESISEEISENDTISSEDSSESSDMLSEESTDLNSSASQTSDSMSASSDSSSPNVPTPTALIGLGSHGLSISKNQGEQGVQFSFTAPETGTYGICSQSILVGDERLTLVYTLGGDIGNITGERQLFTLQENEIILLTAYVYDASLFMENFFVMDLTVTRHLDLGENGVCFTDACVVYFIPPTDGEYAFSASEGVRITYFSYDSLRNEEVTAPLSLMAGEELRLVLQTDGEAAATVTVTKK